MRKWEEIVRNKMEEADETLPESVFAEFRTRRDSAAPAHESKHFSPFWVLPIAVATGIVAILYIHQPTAQKDSAPFIQHSQDILSGVPDLTEIADPPFNQVSIVHTISSELSESSIVPPPQLIPVEGPDSPEEPTPNEFFEEPETENDTVVVNPPIPTTLPISRDVLVAAKAPMKVGAAMSIVAGGGLLGTLGAVIQAKEASVVPQAIGGTPYYGGPILTDEPIGQNTSYFPLRGGVAIGIPIADRLKITTGLEYTLYSSKINYSLSGGKMQYAHYVGVPIRLDWSIASDRWFDVYLGGGFEGDTCIAAFLDGDRIEKDGFSLSLLGTGGIQFNAAKSFGIFLEPELSWALPSKNRILATYRSDHPLMFSVTTGIRFNLRTD